MRIRIVDAFSDRPFAGNPAGVVLLDGSAGFPDAPWLQQVAAEVNLSETAFAHPVADDPDADWALRWFTPATEVNLCGHATLATAHILRSTGAAEGTVRFRTRGGILTVLPAAGGALTLDFPSAPADPVATPPELVRALGAEPLSSYDTGALGDLLVEVADEKTLRGLAPDLAALARLEHRGVVVTAPAEVQDADYQYVSRFFAPAVGVDEDPVTGSAHTALAPYWSARLGRPELVGYQASARGGLVRTRLVGDRVHITGRAVTVIDGELLTQP
ncbi:PhzF family phenazine biosynthesis protein [Wenjunlia tyrosinilytica]|jgi:PhzF family phenazine biosynthesis protein|uniref:Oxidoreductase n=1 Tax=Wenjunlia tyrosinilytica TaxID=1544741 RepID=A0A918DVW1_9ACTN|nr:PhzF family phenazine biosynthesis protein [Wenjunlia tyrosinilytica]GGO84504.1 oxidoreductase [Wenjunlia tyrosinilytica]